MNETVWAYVEQLEDRTLLSSMVGLGGANSSASGVSAAASATITVAPADDLAAIVASAPDGSVIELTAGTFNLASQGPNAAGVRIENITGLTITGQGDSTVVKLDVDVDSGFWFGSNVTDLTISNMHIQGTPPLSTNTAGIGNSTATRP